MEATESRSNREICFSQGKSCTTMPDGTQDIIRTEWPNGTVDELDMNTNVRTRRWPDGTIETRGADSDFPLPIWPRKNEV